MRPFLRALMIAAILFWAGIPSAAAVTEPGSAEIGVYAKTIVVDPPNYYEASASDGVYSVTTDNATVITVKPESPASGLRLVVYQITSSEEQAYRWFEGSTSRLGKDRRYFELYFVDSSGQQTDGGSCTVTITLPSASRTLRVSHLDTSGTLTALPGRVSGRRITFPISENGYYVLWSAKASGSEDPSNPPTGDNREMPFAAMLLSASALPGIDPKAEEKRSTVLSAQRTRFHPPFRYRQRFRRSAILRHCQART